MPVKVKKVDGYRVSTPGGVKAKHTILPAVQQFKKVTKEKNNNYYIYYGKNN